LSKGSFVAPAEKRIETPGLSPPKSMWPAGSMMLIWWAR